MGALGFWKKLEGESGEVGIVMKLIDLVSLYHWA